MKRPPARCPPRHCPASQPLPGILCFLCAAVTSPQVAPGECRTVRRQQRSAKSLAAPNALAKARAWAQGRRGRRRPQQGLWATRRTQGAAKAVRCSIVRTPLLPQGIQKRQFSTEGVSDTACTVPGRPPTKGGNGARPWLTHRARGQRLGRDSRRHTLQHREDTATTQCCHTQHAQLSNTTRALLWSGALPGGEGRTRTFGGPAVGKMQVGLQACVW